MLEGDVADAVARLKAEDGEYVLVIGSSGLIQTLLRHDLVDAFKVWTFPVVVGEYGAVNRWVMPFCCAYW